MTLKEYRDNPYVWPGGYTILALTDDGEFACHKCIFADDSEFHEGGNADGYRIEAFDIYWEGPTVHCCNCNDDIESEYGDPEDEDDD